MLIYIIHSLLLPCYVVSIITERTYTLLCIYITWSSPSFVFIIAVFIALYVNANVVVDVYAIQFCCLVEVRSNATYFSLSQCLLTLGKCHSVYCVRPLLWYWTESHFLRLTSIEIARAIDCAISPCSTSISNGLLYQFFSSVYKVFSVSNS
jgi:hypothetical protein